MRTTMHTILLTMALLFGAVGGIPVSTPAQAGEPAVVQDGSAARQAMTNPQIRQWYNDQVSVIPALDAQWIAQGLSAEDRARKAHDIRHAARLKAREFMQNKQEVADLQERDLAKYGNPDGPTFDFLVEKNRAQGMTGDAAYQAIIGSANRTDPAYNQRNGVKPSGPTP